LVTTSREPTADGWPGEFFGVDFEARGEDITMTRLRGVKRSGGCPTLGWEGGSWGWIAMPRGLKRYYSQGDLHFVTFRCYRRWPLLGSRPARSAFVSKLGRRERNMRFGCS